MDPNSHHLAFCMLMQAHGPPRSNRTRLHPVPSEKPIMLTRLAQASLFVQRASCNASRASRVAQAPFKAKIAPRTLASSFLAPGRSIASKLSQITLAKKYYTSEGTLLARAMWKDDCEGRQWHRIAAVACPNLPSLPLPFLHFLSHDSP